MWAWRERCYLRNILLPTAQLTGTLKSISQGVRAYLIARLFKLSNQIILPGTVMIQRRIYNAMNVRWLFYIRFFEHRDTRSPQSANKIAQFKNNILARPTIVFFGGCHFRSPDVIRRHQNHRKVNIGESLKLFNYRPSAVRLFA